MNHRFNEHLPGVESAITHGLEALINMQTENGSFPLCWCLPDNQYRPADALFSTATVLLAVGELLPSASVARAIAYIDTCRLESGLWHFDPLLDIPPDSDALACALAAYVRFAPEKITRTDYELLELFRRDSGVYKTWYSSEPMWQIVERDDPVVNFNIIHALELLGKPPSDETIDAVGHFVRDQAAHTRYYCDPQMILYTASRTGFPSDQLPVDLFEAPSPQSHCLTQALWLASIDTTRADVTNVMAAVIGQQMPSGAWPAQPWCTGEGLNDLGSEAVSTAICLEALLRVLHQDV